MQPITDEDRKKFLDVPVTATHIGPCTNERCRYKLAGEEFKEWDVVCQTVDRRGDRNIKDHYMLPNSVTNLHWKWDVNDFVEKALLRYCEENGLVEAYEKVTSEINNEIDYHIRRKEWDIKLLQNQKKDLEKGLEKCKLNVKS